MSKNRFLVALIALVALGSLGLAETASACDQQCQIVSPNCRRCIDTGIFTGQTCKNSGSCNCIYTQNNCGGLSAAAAPTAEPDFLLAENASPADAAVAFDLELALAGQ